MQFRSPRLAAALALLAGTSCSSTDSHMNPSPVAPLSGATQVDHLIADGEEHFAHLWQVTRGGENAEAYWSFAGDRLSLQRSDEGGGILCDRIFVTEPGGGLTQVSNGRGTTTCSYFMPDGRSVIFGSTHGSTDSCPPPIDFSQGYVWGVYPEFDLYTVELATGRETALTTEWGYDAEATLSPLGDRIVFTSTRSGDLELWTCALDGGDLLQVTDEIGYDGGGFYSHDGQRIIFRSTAFTPGEEEAEHARYRDLLADWKVKPSNMEIMVVNADGSGRRQLTHLGGANFAPYFFPDDQRFIFSSNHASESGREFDLFVMAVGGEQAEQITHYEGFDSFPMFSPDGRYMAFASNRGGTVPGETNVFIAEWR